MSWREPDSEVGSNRFSPRLSEPQSPLGKGMWGTHQATPTHLGAAAGQVPVILNPRLRGAGAVSGVAEHPSWHRDPRV